MFIGRVNGHIVSSAKEPSLKGRKLLVIEPLKVRYAAGGGDEKGGKAAGFDPTGRAIVAIDMIGAGEGELVLITQGSSARLAESCGDVPTDAVVVGIIDEAVVLGQTLE